MRKLKAKIVLLTLISIMFISISGRISVIYAACNTYYQGKENPIKPSIKTYKNKQLMQNSVDSPAVHYVTRAEFIEMVVKELGLRTDQASGQPYIDAALEAGVITRSTFAGKYDILLTKSDAAVVLVRADEYLYGVTVSDEIVQMVIEKRISDIGKAGKARRPFIAKCYYLGYIVGKGNGEYSTDRRFCPAGKLSKESAELFVSRIKDKDKRRIISPDGQLIRTTKLPSNAELYPYILASYPNGYYDWEFLYMKRVSNGKPLYGTPALINMEDYVAPVDMEKFKYWDYIKEGLESWEEKTRAMMNAIFNVDYRTIKGDKEWKKILLSTSTSVYDPDGYLKRMDKYIDVMTKNKTIIECDKVAVDMSTLYYDSACYVRVYVHYRINSALKTDPIDSADMFGFSSLIFTRDSWPNLMNIKLGEWRDGYYDVCLSINDDFGIYWPVLSDYYHDVRVVK